MHSSPFCAYSVPIASLRPPAPILGRLSDLVSQETVLLLPGTALQGADTKAVVLPRLGAGGRSFQLPDIVFRKAPMSRVSDN